ncbi:MAG: CHASE2 domain-containing protein, partial [Chloroflexota bacterium]
MLRSRKQRQRAILALIVALALALGGYLTGTQYFESNVQAAVYDSFITAAPAKVKNQITVVALDDATVAHYGRWPLPRQAYVDVVQALRPFNPTAISFDIGLYDPSPNPDQDRALAAAIKDAGNVILAMQGAGIPEYRDRAQKFPALIFPLDMFREAAAGLGAVNINPEFDSRVREAQLVIRGPDGKPYYALPLVATARHLRGDLDRIRVDGDILVLPTRAGDRTLPINEGGAMRVYYAAPPAPPVVAGEPACTVPNMFCVVSLVDVVQGKVPKELLQNRSIYVGAHSISAVPDDYPVPNSANQKMYGVEIWANTAQSIFTNRFPVPNQGFTSTLIQLAILTIVGMVLLVAPRSSAPCAIAPVSMVSSSAW